jgi:hypothetical protein
MIRSPVKFDGVDIDNKHPHSVQTSRRAGYAELSKMGAAEALPRDLLLVAWI